MTDALAALSLLPIFFVIAWRTGGISLRPGSAPGVYRGRAENWNRRRGPTLLEF